MATIQRSDHGGAVIEPPYGDIQVALSEGRVVPFLGAGASVGALADEDGAEWSPESRRLPTGRELAGYLAGLNSLPSNDPRDREDLAKVASYSVDVSGRRILRSHLRRALNRKAPHAGLHKLLAAVPAHLWCVVTNYDTLLEDAFRHAGKPFHLVVYPADQREHGNSLMLVRHGSETPEFRPGNEVQLDLDRASVIYKMHGTLWPSDERLDSFVITEEDYVEFLSRMTTNEASAVPHQFYEHSRERSFLFLGYGLRDWNLRVVLRNLRRQLSHATGRGLNDDHIPSWAIQSRPSALEQRLWRGRHVEIFDVDLDNFVTRLTEWKLNE